MKIYQSEEKPKIENFVRYYKRSKKAKVKESNAMNKRPLISDEEEK